MKVYYWNMIDSLVLLHIYDYCTDMHNIVWEGHIGFCSGEFIDEKLIYIGEL